MKLNELYPVRDFIPTDDWMKFKLGPHLRDNIKNVRAEWTGEYRAPKAGEWYFSGAVVEAWRATSDMTCERHIAELVLTETVVRRVTCSA